MAFPDRLLAPDEQVVVEARPNWSVLSRPVALVLVVLAACIAVLAEWASPPSVLPWVLLALVAAAFVFLVARLVSYRARLLVITTDRVIYRFGVVHRTGREIPLRRVQDVTYHQTLMQRLCRAGSLTIESAGAGGSEPFCDIARPAEMQSLINRLIVGGYRLDAGDASDEYSDPPTSELPAMPPPPNGSGGGVLREQLVHLERLHELGVLDDAEFHAKRRSLLSLD